MVRMSGILGALSCTAATLGVDWRLGVGGGGLDLWLGWPGKLGGAKHAKLIKDDV